MKRFIIDADRRFLPPVAKKLKTSDGPLPPSVDIPKLEDAVFNDQRPLGCGRCSFRVKFLRIYQDFTKQQLYDGSRREKVLLYCWNSLGWRPNHAATKVLLARKNPYVK
jgi:hypothetical protein